MEKLTGPAARSDLAVELLEGEAVILDLRGSRVHQLNASGALVWSLLDGDHPPPALAAALAEAFDVSLEQALADTVTLLAELDALGLLEPFASEE